MTNLAARARESIAFLQERHCALRRQDGEPHRRPTDECDCSLAQASQVIVELLEVARTSTHELLESQRMSSSANAAIACNEPDADAEEAEIR